MALLQQQQHQRELAGEPDQRDLISAATAFFKWRQAALKANFRRELEGILEEVAQEEEATGKVQLLLQKTQERLDETTHALTKSTNDHRLALAQIDQLRVQNDELFRTLEAAEGASRVHADQARQSALLHQEEVKRRQDESRRSTLEIEGLREQYQAALAQQQALLDSLAQRDREIADANAEGLHHKRNAARLQEEVERLEAIARATGERAAAAEAQAAARQESIGKLYAELSGLRERYHAELSDLKAARVGAAEVQRMKERVDSMQATNDSLVAARDELRASLEGVMAKLNAAEQRLKRQAVAATMRDSIIDTIANVSRELVGSEGDESLILQATTRLSSELDLALANNTDLAERLTSADAVIAQQQGHIRRLAEEISSLETQLRESREHRDAQHRLNAELASELKRLAAESALGPILALDKDGNLVPQEGPPPAAPAATAPATSQLEAQSTAVRVILADKGFGLGALCQAIATNPGSVQSVRAQLSECRSLAEALKADVEEVGALLAVRPFEADELSRKLPVLQDRLSKTETCFVSVREDLTLKQVHAVALEARVLAAESAMRSGSSLLQGWSGLLSQVVAAEDGRLEPDVRLGLREELKTREDALHRAMLDLAANAPPLLGGDPGYAAAQLAMREGCNAMMDLALTLGDRIVDAPATRTRVLAAEQLLLDRAGHLARFREVLSKAPGGIADMVERLTGVIPDVQTMGPAVEEMLRCVQHYLAAGREPTVDVVALQGEVLMLRGLVRTKDIHIHALEAVGTGLRTGSPTKRVQKMVPLEALHAAERARDAEAGEKAALQARLVDQRVLLVAARHRIVSYMASLRTACETAEVFYKWRTTVATIKADRCCVEMMTAQKERAQIEQQSREDKARMEAEVEALRTSHATDLATLIRQHSEEVAALAAAHATAIATMQTEHEEEQRRFRDLTLQAAELRVKAIRRIVKEKTARFKEVLQTAMLYYWRFRVHRQSEARARWQDFSDRLRFREEPYNPTYRDIMLGPRLTIARRLAQMYGDPGDLRTPQAMTGRQIARTILQAWRGWAYIRRQGRKVEALTEAIPTFMNNLGDRRRLERAWLALRLWAAGSATERAHQAIHDYEASNAEAQAARLAAETAKAQSDAAATAAEEEKQRLSAIAADAAAQAGLQLALPPGFPGGGFGAGGYATGTQTGGYSTGTQTFNGVTTGQQTDSAPSYMLYQLPTMEVGTQYLPHAQTVLTSGATAAEHAAAADAVAAAQAAGLNVAFQPMTTSQHQGGMGTLGAWGGLRGPGAMPPVAGPSQAAVTAALSHRRTSEPGGGDEDGGGGGGRGFRSSLATRTGRAASSGRLPPGQRTAQRQGTGTGRQKGTVRPTGPVTAAVASLQERAERLARAVDAIGAGVADTAALLSPRRKVLQVEAEPGGESGSADGYATNGLEYEQQGYDEGDFDRLPPGSPTRRLQADGSTSVEYGLMSSDGGAPRSPPLGAGGDLRYSRDPLVELPPSSSVPMEIMPAAAAAVGAATQRARSASQPRRSGGRTGTSPRTSGGLPARNSVQVLLGQAPGGRGRQDSRSYGHVSSRLHDETLSTMAKKRKAGRPAGDRAQGPASVEVPPPPGFASVRSAPAPYTSWPHAPASTLPSAPAGPNTVDFLRRRTGAPGPDPLIQLPTSIGIPVPVPAPTINAPIVAPLVVPQSVAPPPGKTGRVIRFERMTPGPMPPPIKVTADGAGGAGGPQVYEPPEDQGLVTYIQLPSPVKVSIKLPGT